VTLAVVTSANQTAPSGATAQPAQMTMGVDSGNEWMLPSGEICEIARFWLSVYQTRRPPPASTASPSGSRVLGPLGEALDLAIPKYGDRIGELDGKPDGSIRRDSKRRRDIRS